MNTRKLIVLGFKDAEGKNTIIIKKSATKEGWGSVMVMESKLTISNGIIQTRNRVGFLRAKLTELNALDPKLGEDLNAKFIALGAGPHKVRVTESIEKQFEGQREKINPTTKAIVKDAAGNPIYMSTEVVPDTDEEKYQDVLLAGLSAPVAVAAEAGEVK